MVRRVDPSHGSACRIRTDELKWKYFGILGSMMASANWLNVKVLVPAPDTLVRGDAADPNVDACTKEDFYHWMGLWLKDVQWGESHKRKADQALPQLDGALVKRLHGPSTQDAEPKQSTASHTPGGAETAPDAEDDGNASTNPQAADVDDKHPSR